MEEGHVKQKKMTFWIGIILATIFLLVTIVVFATKLFFPHHRMIALIVYAMGWIPFLYSISLRKQWVLRHQEIVSSFFQAYWIHLVFGVVMLLAVYVLLTLFPPVKSPFIGLADDEINQRLDEDKTIVLYLNDELEGHITQAIDSGILNIDFKDISGEKKQDLQNFWFSFIEAMLELDAIKGRYKSFYQLNPITKKDLHRQAFENGYAAFLTQHHAVFSLSQLVSDENIRTFFNQPFSDYGIESGTFDLLREKLTDADELLRLNTGRAYYWLIREAGSDLDKVVAGHLDEIDSAIASYAHLLAKKPLNFLEKNSFKLWFPVQKKAAAGVSYVRTASRDYHIKPDQIQEYKDRLLPGDILLERREWHATNVGIPGFWTHAALYIGTLPKMNEHFKDVPELNGSSFEEYLKENHKLAYEKLLQSDEDGYSYAVIESKRPGVILTSLEFTANADSFAALRVRSTDRSDHFKIVTQALSHFGKPYDFDFNFVTDNALVCSELVYKAYQDVSQLNLEVQEVNGRPIISPNQFAEKFTQELEKDDSELDLILFLDGNEKTRQATEKGAVVFAETWERPKWHVTKDFVDFQ